MNLGLKLSNLGGGADKSIIFPKKKDMIRQSLPHYWNYYQHSNDSVLIPHLGLSCHPISSPTYSYKFFLKLGGKKYSIDHCIDSLRLSIMCHGDMTFAPIIWSEIQGRMIPDFETLHTCRDYDALKNWANNRDASNPKRWPKNAERLRSSGNRK